MSEYFQYDLHTHTAEVSGCSRLKAHDLVKRYKDAGYDGIVISDHYYKRYFDRLGDISWEEKVDCYLSGYKNALKAAKDYGMTVLLGAEISFAKDPVEDKRNDFLVFGIDEDFLKEHKELYNLELVDLKLILEQNNMMLYQAHPFRPMCQAADPTLLDGIEVYNGNPRHTSNNPVAYEFCKKHGLLSISGSDAHEIEDIGNGGIKVNRPINSSSELVDALRQGIGIELIMNGKDRVY